MLGYDGDNASSSVAAGDFNGDGKLDVAAATAFTGLSIFLSVGDGTFLIPAAQPLAQLDGTWLLLTSTRWQTRCSSCHDRRSSAGAAGNGDGNFAAPVAFAMRSAASAISVGDFDGDRKPDLTVSDNNGFSIFLGNGGGTFVTPDEYGSNGSSSHIATADFNGDGKLDIAAANGSTLIALGSGDETFPLSSHYGSAPRSFQVYAGDFNSDGQPDLAVVRSRTNCYAEFRGSVSVSV